MELLLECNHVAGNSYYKISEILLKFVSVILIVCAYLFKTISIFGMKGDRFNYFCKQFVYFLGQHI